MRAKKQGQHGRRFGILIHILLTVRPVWSRSAQGKESSAGLGLLIYIRDFVNKGMPPTTFQSAEVLERDIVKGDQRWRYDFLLPEKKHFDLLLLNKRR